MGWLELFVGSLWEGWGGNRLVTAWVGWTCWIGTKGVNWQHWHSFCTRGTTVGVDARIFSSFSELKLPVGVNLKERINILTRDGSKARRRKWSPGNYSFLCSWRVSRSYRTYLWLPGVDIPCNPLSELQAIRTWIELFFIKLKICSSPNPRNYNPPWGFATEFIHGNPITVHNLYMEIQ